MAFFDYFRKRSAGSASLAKDRLSIIVARQHGRSRASVPYLPQLKQELLQVLARYEKIDLDQVTVSVERNGNCEVLEVNVILADTQAPRGAPAEGEPFFADAKCRADREPRISAGERGSI